VTLQAAVAVGWEPALVVIVLVTGARADRHECPRRAAWIRGLALDDAAARSAPARDLRDAGGFAEAAELGAKAMAVTSWLGITAYA
jgi:hypothetical protein